MNDKFSKFLFRVLRTFCKPEYLEEIEGDLLERYEQHGSNWRLALEIVNLFRREVLKKSKNRKLNSYSMFRHNLKLAVRGFKKFKSSFAINLIGLSSGLACTILIYLWVNDEWQKDKFHDSEDPLFQVMQNINIFDQIYTMASTPAPLGSALLADFPSVKKVAAVVPAGSYGDRGIIEYGDKQLKALNQYASRSYFDVLSFPLKMGDKKSVLNGKRNVVISEKFAKNLFQEGENPVGKSITWIDDGEKENFIVSGVFASLPSSSSENFDVVFTMEKFIEDHEHLEDWRNSDPHTFLRLSKNVSADKLNEKIKNYLQSKHESINSTIFLQQYSDRYLNGKYENGVPVAGRLQYVQLFSAIALLVLMIACINFLNLSTAQASRRLKEIGVKKALGVTRKDLVIQFFTEVFTLSLVSILVAFSMTYIFLDPFNAITGKSINLDFDPQLLIFSIAVLISTTLLAGGYPALYLSGFKPILMLKGKLTDSKDNLWARHGLVTFQYMASIILIASVWVVSSQIKFIQSKNLGYNKNQIIYFNTDGRLSEQAETFVHELKQLPGIENAGGFNHNLLGQMGTTTSVKWEGMDPESKIKFANLEVGYGLIETFDMQLIAGRPFSSEEGDSKSRIIINEKAAEVFGYQQPIGKVIELWGKNREIIGVVKSFHFESLHQEIKPCFFQLSKKPSSIVVRIAQANGYQTIERIEKLYHDYNPGITFNFQFLEQELNALYKSEKQVASLSTFFAALAIIISCLGLFGLVAFTAERKQKETAIRKVLGANVLRLVLLLSGDFAKTVLVAIVISIPLSYWLMNMWLDSFVYKIDLNIWLFLGAGFIAIVIAITTMSVQTFRAAAANPVESLKDE